MPTASGSGYDAGNFKDQAGAAQTIVEYGNDFIEKTRDGELSQWEQGQLLRDSLVPIQKHPFSANSACPRKWALS
jgi:hypothetical protein